MKTYDLTVLFPADGESEALNKLVEKIEKMIKAAEGKVGKQTEMGKKQLAYKIKKITEAQFVNWQLELPGSAVVQFDRKLTQDKDVIRHLLVKHEGRNGHKISK